MKITKSKVLNALGIALIAGLITFLDALFCAYIFSGHLFIWIAFASWTVFFTASTKDRIKTLPGYLIGMLASIAIIYLGSAIAKLIPMKINGTDVSSFIATILIVFCIMFLYEIKLLNFTSISSVFIGIWVIFSGLGAGMYPNSFKETIIIMAIVIGYSIVGLIAGYLSMLLYKQTAKLDNTKKPQPPTNTQEQNDSQEQ